MSPKLTLLAMTLTLTSSLPALSCAPEEAQFIGQVTSTETNDLGVCMIKVGNFSFYNESKICPLNSVDAINLAIPVSDCTMKTGDEVSGVISVDKDGRVWL
ncbi:MAG: hypothetical protein V4760_19375 [Bdellovibrionota bacterium]